MFEKGHSMSNTGQLIEDFMATLLNFAGKEDKRWYFFRRPEISECERKLNKSLVEFDKDDIILLFKSFRLRGAPLTNPMTISHFRSKYSSFYKWARTKGLRTDNPFECKELSQKDMVDLLTVETNTTKLLTEDEYQDLISRVRGRAGESAFYYEAIIRAFYEGVNSVTELLKIKNYMFFPEDSIINQGYKRIYASRELNTCLRKMQLATELVGLGGNKKPLVTIDDSLFRITVKAKNPPNNLEGTPSRLVNAKSTISHGRFKEISEMAGQTITSTMLYDSGLIQFIKKNTASSAEFYDLMVGEDNPNEKINRLTRILLDYGSKYEAKSVRFRFKSLIIAMGKKENALDC